MSIKRFLTILRDLFLPQRRNDCPHCGGVRCIGACQFEDAKPGEPGGQGGNKKNPSHFAAGKKA